MWPTCWLRLMHTEFWDRALRNQADILAQLKAIRTQGATGVRVPVLPEECPRQPAKDVLEMRALNTYLGDVEKLEQMADYLRQIGGADEKAATRAVLSALISNSLGKRCSWAGSKGAKEAISDEKNILALVLASCVRPKYGVRRTAEIRSSDSRWTKAAGNPAVLPAL
ncbi:uncharacterized protein LOC144166050 [Haemaphysalis longicornis]